MIPVDAREFNCVDHVLYYFKVERKAEIYCIYFQSVLRPSCKLSDTSTLWLICNYLFLLLQSCLFHLFCLPFGSVLQAFTLIVPISIVRASPESCIPKIVKVSTWNEADNGPFADSTVSALWVIANQLCGAVIDSESLVPTKLLHLHVGSLLILQPLKKVTGDARSCFRPFQLHCSYFPWTKSKEDFAWYQHGCLSSSPPPLIP